MQILQTQEQHIPQDWTGDVLKGADIALLKLKDPLEDAVYAGMADGTLGLFSSQILTVIGWGRTSARGPLAENLQSGDIELLDNEQCKLVHPDETILDSMVCAGGSAVDSCEGENPTCVWQ